MLYSIYNRELAVGEKIDGLPFLSFEDFWSIEGLPSNVFILALDSIVTLKGRVLR